MNHDPLTKIIVSALQQAGYERLRDLMAAHTEWIGETRLDDTAVYLSGVVFQELDDESGRFLDLVVEAHYADGSIAERNNVSFYSDGRIVCESVPLAT